MSKSRDTGDSRNIGGGRLRLRCTHLLLVALLVGPGAGCDPVDSGSSAVASASPPESPAVWKPVTSIAGRYTIELRPATPPIVLGEIHDWVIRLSRTDGGAARTVRVSLDGGMPAHGHGFTTSPRVTRALGEGEYLVEGVKFHMAGDWQLRVLVTDSEGSDGIAVPLSLAP